MSNSPRALSICLLGEADRAEFQAARRCLDSQGIVACFDDVDGASAALGQTIRPDVIVVVQAFPGQFSHSAVDRLRRASPLTPIVGLMGSWCEGEVRTGSPWPGTTRTYWHQWQPRCDRQLRRTADSLPGPWTLPPTATDEERLLADVDDSPPRRDGLIVISSHSTEMANWLSAACRDRGFATIWQRGPLSASVRGATAAIFDGSDGGPNEQYSVASLVRAIQPAPVIALLSFPRIEDTRRIMTAGAAAALSKPLSIEDLFWQLDEVAHRTHAHNERQSHSVLQH